MQIKRLQTSFFLAILALGLAIYPVLAFPPLPSSFYGTVNVNGNPLPNGTLVRALINGVPYAETHTMTYQSNSVYSLSVAGDDLSTTDIVEGGKEGDIIHFEIGKYLINQTSIWHSGTNAVLNLVTPFVFTYISVIRK